MKIGYTEFSFGYAFTENLVRSSGLPSEAPIFPNLVQEASLGFDMQFTLPTAPLFFQFKLPQRMRRETAFEISKYNCYGLHVSFFRIDLMRADISHQHRNLLSLESHFPDSVYYASAHIHSMPDFNTNYLNGSVPSQSSFFRPSDIGTISDNKQHSIAYSNNIDFAYLFSEPKMIKRISFDSLIDTMSRRFDEKRFSDWRSVIRETRDVLARLTRPGIGSREARIASDARERIRQTRASGATPPDETLVDLLVARDLARLGLGAELAIGQPRP